jgi:hypothetical protein
MVQETSFTRLKKAILELKEGYPEYVFYGKIEYFVKTGKHAVGLLERHGIIEKISKKEVEARISQMTQEEAQKLPKNEEDRLRWYRLTSRGVNLAISMINLEHSERILGYSNKMEKLTSQIKWLTIIMTAVAILAFAATILNIPFVQDIILHGVYFNL